MNKNKKTVVIIGAGPAGLACAYELIKNSEIQPIIIEKLPCVGGLSRTVYKNGSGVDIGGHRLHTSDEYIKSIWFQFLKKQNAPAIDDLFCQRELNFSKDGANPNEVDDVMMIRRRFSSIIYNSKFFPYPLKFELSTFLNLGLITSFKAGLSYIKSMIFKRKEVTLEDFMVNRFGYVLYSIFFKDYTKKVWGLDASELSCEWGHQRIRKLSLFKTILNSIVSKFKFIKFKKETSLIDEFYYPKYGCSQLWDLMAKYIIDNGGQIYYNCEFAGFNYQNNRILSVKCKENNGLIKDINANYIVSTIPINELITGIDAPLNIKQEALNLPYRDYILVSFYTNKFNLKNKTDYKTINDITPDCWIYLQERDAIAARIQIMNNWSPYLVNDFRNNYLISLEYFANENDDFWQKTDDEIIEIAKMEAQKYDLFKQENVIESFIVREKKAYPTYFGSYKNINEIKKYISKYDNLYLAGRNGQHQYNNMDEAMISGINVAREIIKR